MRKFSTTAPQSVSVEYSERFVTPNSTEWCMFDVFVFFGGGRVEMTALWLVIHVMWL